MRASSRRRATLPNTLEQPDNSGSRQAEQGQPAKHIDKSPIGRLIEQLVIELHFGRIPGVRRAELVAQGAHLKLGLRLPFAFDEATAFPGRD